MPIRAELRTERGEVVRGLDDPAGGTFDAAGRLRRTPATSAALVLPPPLSVTAYTLLKYVDPYGDTILNSGQMDDLLHDIEVARSSKPTPVQQRGLDRLRVMAQRCRDGVHLCIWFIGD